jgi:hypothetical protein
MKPETHIFFYLALWENAQINMNIMRYGVNVNETTTPKSNCMQDIVFT